MHSPSPDTAAPAAGAPGAPLLEVRDLRVSFPLRGGPLRRRTGAVQAVSGVSLSVMPGTTLGIVGESGCGKSTLARTIVGLQRPDSGSVRFDAREVGGPAPRDRKALAKDVQIIYQDPFASLNPRKTVRRIIEEGWLVHPEVVPRERRAEAARELLARVGLDPAHADRYPHQFSGGQRQRIGTARALALRPRLVVCDEPVSALDVSVQAQILNLLAELQREFALTYVFISHDLTVVRHFSDELAVMYLGEIVETGRSDRIHAAPAHPYTAALLSAAPVPRPWAAPPRERTVLSGDLPSPADPPSGCRFRTRCPIARPRCAAEHPSLREVRGRLVACHYAEDAPEAGR